MKENSIGVVTTNYVTFKDEFFLQSGRVITPITVAYETYGKLNAEKDNAILVCHALTGSAHAAGYSNGDEDKVGWWEEMIGPNKAFDTNKYFVICSNILGSCYGTTGPASIDNTTGKPYGLRFPVVTVKDMVKLQKKLISKLGIEKLLSVAGGSMGGMQALEWGVTYPDNVESVIVISSAGRITPMAIAFNAIARFAIKKDPNWQDGNYYGKSIPRDGLAIGRMAGHITYLSDIAFHQKFGRRLGSQDSIYDFNSAYEVENYLYYNGYKFTERFDANSYLYILKAMDIFDLSYGFGSYEEALRMLTAKTLLIDFTTDILFPPYQTDEIVDIMTKCGNEPERVTIESDNGHDAFLQEYSEQTAVISAFLQKVRSAFNI